MVRKNSNRRESLLLVPTAGITRVRASQRVLAALLRGPRGRALADKFYASLPGVKEYYAENPEELYDVFAKLVEVNIDLSVSFDLGLQVSFVPKGLDRPLDIGAILEEWWKGDLQGEQALPEEIDREG